jgi:hypothetical protein
MNEMLSNKYPAVQVETPMPINAPATLLHRGQLIKLPGKFDHATATYLFSLLDYQTASWLCDGENFQPLSMSAPQSVQRAVGLVSVIDYHQTDVGPYREWILGLWVVPKGEPVPVLNWVNPASLFFHAVLSGDKRFTCFSPKMILTEPLPIEVGVEHYGIPKELGQVSYECAGGRMLSEVQDSAGQWIMRLEAPTTRGFVARCRFLLSLVRAFGVESCFRLAQIKEMSMIVTGSAKLRPKNALLVSKVDPQSDFLVWDDRDCQLTTNPKTQWGKVLQSLSFSPSLICHVPNLAFVFSGPFDPVLGEVTPVNR